VVAAEHEREDAGVDERREPGLDPPIRAFGVAGSHGQVAVVDDGESVEDVDVEGGMVGAKQH
jgi:hypothetical protein